MNDEVLELMLSFTQRNEICFFITSKSTFTVCSSSDISTSWFYFLHFLECFDYGLLAQIIVPEVSQGMWVPTGTALKTTVGRYFCHNCLPQATYVRAKKIGWWDNGWKPTCSDAVVQRVNFELQGSWNDLYNTLFRKITLISILLLLVSATERDRYQ